MKDSELRVSAIFEEIRAQATIADTFLDRDKYQLLVCTIWANLVMNPEDAGIPQDALESVHDEILEQVQIDLGADADLRSCFQFLTTKTGEQAMQANKVGSTHKDLLLYFSSMILDPEGHQRWSNQLREQQRD